MILHRRILRPASNGHMTYTVCLHHIEIQRVMKLMNVEIPSSLMGTEAKGTLKLIKETV